MNPGISPFRRPARLLALAALCAGLLAAPAATQALGPAVAGQNLSNTPDQSELPKIASGGGWLVAIWGERGGKRLGFSSARPDGAWSPAEFLSTGTNTKVQPPDIVADSSGAAHIVYAVGDQVLYRHRPVGGGWSPAVAVASSRFANQTRITRAPDGTLWVVWRDIDGTAIFYRFSTDGGATWRAADERGVVAEEDSNMLAPAIAVDASNSPHVVWYIRSLGERQGEIRYADWDGARFRAGSVTRDGPKRYDADPAILVSPQNIQHLVWRKQLGTRWVIMYATRAPGGDWQDIESLTTTKGDAQFAPSIGTDERGDILIGYSDPTGNGARRIMLLGRTPGGEWASFPISNGYLDSRSAVIGTITGSNVFAHVLYQHEATVDDGEVLYARVQVDFLAAPQPAAEPQPAAAPQPAGAAGALDGALVPAGPRGDCAFFPETQHNLCGAFRSYWQRYGGLPIYGFPLTEEYGADGVVTQYFERARFEYHPGQAPARFDVLLGLLGSERVAGRRESGDPAFQPAGPRAGCTFFPETQHNLCGAQRSYWQRYGGLPLYGFPLTDEFIENGVAVQYFERARLEHQPGAAPGRFNVLAGRIGAEAIGR